MKIYLAGPMEGLPDLNRAAFNAAALEFRAEGHTVFNPAAANLEGMPMRQIMKYELSWICDEADAVAMLPNWENSKGAKVEYALATKLGLPVILL